MKKIFFLLVLFLSGMGTFISCRKPPPWDKAPVALAGPDQVITLPTDSISLDGSASSDPDGNISEWLWTKISGPASFYIVNSSNAKTIVKKLVAGTYQFELRVNDDKGISAKDTMMVTVDATPQSNHPPVADAGTDTTIASPANTVTLDGSGSTDRDNNIIYYQWAKISGPSSFNIANTGAVQTQATNLVEGVYQFELTVTDAGGLFAKDTVRVTINPDLSPAIDWQKAFGGTGDDVASSIQPTGDGGYIVSGNTNSQDGDVTGFHPGANNCYETCFGPVSCYFPDALLTKLNSAGAIQWQKALGGSGADYALCAQPTADGGYIMSGYTNSIDGDVSGYHGGSGNEADAWVVKLSSSGAVQWQRTLGGTGCEFASWILSTPDGGYIIAGHTDSQDGDVVSNHGDRDVWIIKLNGSGAIQWQKTLGGSKSDYAYFIQSTPDGGYIVTGNTESNDGDVTDNHGGQDVWVVKLGDSGDIQWQTTLGGTDNENANSIQPTTDGGYIVAGKTNSKDGDVSGYHGGGDAWVVKLSGSGALQWQKALGGTGNDVAHSIQPTADGGYIIAGETDSNDGDVVGNHGNWDAWLVKLSSSGAVQWQKTLGGSSADVAQSIQPTADGGYIVAGEADSDDGDVSGARGGGDAWVIKLKL